MRRRRPYAWTLKRKPVTDALPPVFPVICESRSASCWKDEACAPVVVAAALTCPAESVELVRLVDPVVPDVLVELDVAEVCCELSASLWLAPLAA